MSSSVGARIFSAAAAMLESWPGFPVLSQLVEKNPTLDVYLAGGALRDLLLGLPSTPRDLDLVINGEPLDSVVGCLQSAGGKVTFGPFGSPRWYTPGDASYADIVHVRHFYNGLSYCESIDDVLRQFDFTANAVALHLRTRDFCDPVGGYADISQRIMRGVRFDYPDEPISDTHAISRLSVLWFRLLHYAAACGLNIEPKTMRWLVEHRRFRRDLQRFTQLFFRPHLASLLIYDPN